MTSTSLKALIFDVDGTIAETENHGHRTAFNRAFADAGLDWQWTENFYGELLDVSGGKERIRHYIEQYHPDYVSDDLEAFISKIHISKSQHYQQILQQGIPLRPGIKRIMQQAKEAGIKLAIATTSSLPNAMALVEKHLDPDWFDVIAAGDIVPRKKPAPDIYYYVLEQLELKPTECLVLEDSEHGLTAANQAGIPTIITINNYTRSQDFRGAILVVDHLGEPHKPMSLIRGNIATDYLYIDQLQQLHQSLV